MSNVSPSAAFRLVCHLEAPADCGDLAGARLRVSVEDVSMADAASVVVAQVESVLLSTDDLDRPVEIEATISPGRDYAVRAHVSRSREEQVSTGDLITVARHRLPPDAGTAQVVLPLIEVRPTSGE